MRNCSAACLISSAEAVRLAPSAAAAGGESDCEEGSAAAAAAGGCGDESAGACGAFAAAFFAFFPLPSARRKSGPRIPFSDGLTGSPTPGNFSRRMGCQLFHARGGGGAPFSLVGRG